MYIYIVEIFVKLPEIQSKTMALNPTRKLYSYLFFFFVSVFSGGQYLYGQQVVAPKYFSLPENVIEGVDYLEDVIIIKLKDEPSDYVKQLGAMPVTLNEVLKQLNTTDPKRLFPGHDSPALKYHTSGQPLTDLSKIYHIRLPKGSPIETTINELYNTGMVEYAQPWYLPQTFSVPNDPFIGSQYYLNTIRAFDAWQIEKGDTTVIIAILDTGIDLQHPDLVKSIAYNYNDPINGKDSDNDGYIDNFYGWDLGNNDNNPQWDVNAHGVHVAGIAAATANNGTGMAGVGYNSRLLPLKISDQDGRLVHAYESIVYAADRGAKVINCSWGGAVSAGQFGQDIINYAVLNRDALVVAAAGNSSNTLRIFPASYENALSVTATESNDAKWSGSSYGFQVDISAPGANIFSTWINGTYIVSGGTSMAAPIVSGAAALLRARFPTFSAHQVAAQLKVTSDVNDTLPANKDFKGMLGRGRVNIFRALTEQYHPYLQFVRLQYPMDTYRMVSPGASFQLGAEFVNILAAADGMYAILNSQSSFIEIISDYSELGKVEQFQKINNFSTPFLVRLKGNIPASHEANFTISFFTGQGLYAGQQNFTMTFNLDYLDFSNGLLLTTVNSRGNVGYNYPNYNQGSGFIYPGANLGRNLLRAAGLVAGTSTSKVVDNIYGPIENSFSNFFSSLENARFVDNPPLGNKMIRGSFDDSQARAFRVGLKVDYRIYAFTESPINKFIILEYDLINQSAENLPGFYAGFFADWVIQDVRNHRASYDADHLTGYAFSANGGNFTGTQLLSHTDVRHYAFDNQGFGGSLRLNDGFTSFEKYTAMRSNRDNAGFFDKDNDVSNLISAGPFNVLMGDTLKVAFALIAGDHLNDLMASAQMAALVYKGEFTSSKEITGVSPLQLTAFPVPFNDVLQIQFSDNQNNKAIVRIFDLKARLVSELVASPVQLQSVRIDTSALKPGTYILQVVSGDKIESMKIVK